ncbi:FIST domain-containing protein [Heliobacterium gestii]|uniref:FIST domain-containing protein n=1 Tax=Heliomicrobium gestii TaxID=2699 RepID=A0A845LC85_HELGE|nr:FIST C-terminal domain-containing protein [Heliomicrobium gestii]MBM7867243.1 hypothetical protein [Heliomicrobium gestii]MZP43798.1 FIST domain-containing protein [Heliomicrobium gestii]
MYLASLTELTDYIASLTIEPTEQLMVLTADKSAQHVPRIIDHFNEKGIRFFGGIYAALLVGAKSYDEGFIVIKVEPLYSSLVLPYLMRFPLDAATLGDTTAILLVDGLSSKFKELTDTAYAKIGNKVKYIGGGAGFYDLIHRPCIYDNRGLHKDVLYVCLVKGDIQLGVEHGWRKMDGPYQVTHSRGNILSEIDGQQAFEVYKDIIEQAENLRLSREDFFSFAKDHPFGVQKRGHFEITVRDPITVNEDNEIVCVADIPQDSEIYVLKGNINTLLAASEQVADCCAKAAPETYLPLLFDCISRGMFLEDRFDEELANIQRRLCYPLEGALSIGEIASRSNGDLIIHNKSTILGLLPVKGK